MMVPGSLYLLALLNSKAIDYYIRNLGVTRNGGYFEYKPMFVEHAPIPIVSASDELYKTITSLVNSRDYSQIDTIIYSFFNFTEEEIDYIEQKII